MRKRAAFLAACLLFPRPLSAAEPSVQVEPLGYENLYAYRFAVSPLRAPQEIRRITENVTVLDETALGRLPARDAADALTAHGGLDVSARTRFGHFAPLSIQGSTSRQVLVMVDGIPFNTQASGQADVLAQLPYEGLERIEIVRGSASAAWGQASGGVIHLLTKEPSKEPLHAKFTGAWGEFNSQSETFTVDGSQHETGYLVSGEYREAGGSRRHGGTPDRDDTLQRKIFGKLTRAVTDTVRAIGQFGAIDSDVNEGVYPSDSTRNQVPYYSRYGQARVEFERERQKASAALKFNRQLIQSENFEGVTDVRNSRTRTRDRYYGGEFNYSAGLREDDLFVAGYDASNYILTTTLMDRSREVWLHAPYASYTMALDPLTLKFGAREDFNDEYGDQFNPSAGAVYRLPGEREQLVRVNVSRAFTAPPLLWKYFEDAAPGFTANSPDLRPERAWVYEAGFETWAIDDFWFKLGVFRSDIRDAISNARNAQGLVFKSNFERFRQQGVELESKYRVCSNTELSFASTVTDVEDETTDRRVRGRGVTRPSFRLSIDYFLPCGFRAFLGGRYDRWDSTASVEPNDRKWIVDGRLSHTWEGLQRGLDLTCFLNAYNLTNSKYWSDRDFPLAERYFEGGFTLEF